ncbi:hypothetical protein V8C86DRAFT_2566456 [Haematococcus lacustris]
MLNYPITACLAPPHLLLFVLLCGQMLIRMLLLVILLLPLIRLLALVQRHRWAVVTDGYRSIHTRVLHRKDGAPHPLAPV